MNIMRERKHFKSPHIHGAKEKLLLNWLNIWHIYKHKAVSVVAVTSRLSQKIHFLPSSFLSSLFLFVSFSVRKKMYLVFNRCSTFLPSLWLKEKLNKEYYFGQKENFLPQQRWGRKFDWRREENMTTKLIFNGKHIFHDMSNLIKALHLFSLRSIYSFPQ